MTTLPHNHTTSPIIEENIENTENVVKIGDETILITDDPDIDGYYYSPEGDIYTRHSIEEAISESYPDPGNRNYGRINDKLPKLESNMEKLDHPEDYRLCKHPPCSEIVPPSKNPGVKRLFCSPAHTAAYHTKAWRLRNRTRSGQFLSVEDGYQKQFHRTKPLNSEQAILRYRGHLEYNKCPNATMETSYKCPSHVLQDYYNEKKTCLIYATLVDDMKEQLSLEQEMQYVRKNTTNDGRWLDLSELAPHISEKDGIIPKYALTKPK